MMIPVDDYVRVWCLWWKKWGCCMSLRMAASAERTLPPSFSPGINHDRYQEAARDLQHHSLPTKRYYRILFDVDIRWKKWFCCLLAVTTTYENPRYDAPYPFKIKLQQHQTARLWVIYIIGVSLILAFYNSYLLRWFLVDEDTDSNIRYTACS